MPHCVDPGGGDGGGFELLVDCRESCVVVLAVPPFCPVVWPVWPSAIEVMGITMIAVRIKSFVRSILLSLLVSRE